MTKGKDFVSVVHEADVACNLAGKFPKTEGKPVPSVHKNISFSIFSNI